MGCFILAITALTKKDYDEESELGFMTGPFFAISLNSPHKIKITGHSFPPLFTIKWYTVSFVSTYPTRLREFFSYWWPVTLTPYLDSVIIESQNKRRDFMYISWREEKGRGKAYAYLRASYWDSELKKPKAKIVYLGNNLQEAQEALEAYFNSAQVVVPRQKQLALLNQLKSNAPTTARGPKQDKNLEVTIRVLQKRIAVHKARAEVVKILQTALEKISEL